MGKRKREKEGDKDHGEAEETDIPPKRMKSDEAKVEERGTFKVISPLGEQLYMEVASYPGPRAELPW